ncbi:response regulator [Curvibacter sp. RS43]|jgi:two-component system chemotaxis response regulator CheY|uniref:Response regulator n=1 Tax=Curvibacter microcysteis TaxID=3026419 RepID=A0ABT5MHY5_9BURK|nr:MULTISPECIES: response regulator [unclassified Curvibacter]MDD0812511.1 response regulator [Curvibacter sp. RS43]MDD0815980.1 response regulator [Curvibacter sp. HBC28]
MKRILIIDDAATVRMFHRGILEGAGYQVDEAVNGVEALEKALLTPFDLYIVDVNMPKLDGYGFLRELRNQNLPQVPAIMVSTEATADDRRRAYAAGANLYLVKPTRPDQLVAPIALLLGEVSP